jgi:hypothetical protein
MIRLPPKQFGEASPKWLVGVVPRSLYLSSAVLIDNESRTNRHSRRKQYIFNLLIWGNPRPISINNQLLFSTMKYSWWPNSKSPSESYKPRPTHTDKRLRMETSTLGAIVSLSIKSMNSSICFADATNILENANPCRQDIHRINSASQPYGDVASQAFLLHIKATWNKNSFSQSVSWLQLRWLPDCDSYSLGWWAIDFSEDSAASVSLSPDCRFCVSGWRFLLDKKCYHESSFHRRPQRRVRHSIFRHCLYSIVCIFISGRPQCITRYWIS